LEGHWLTLNEVLVVLLLSKHFETIKTHTEQQ